MDRKRFDALARMLAAGGSRRGVLAAVLSGAALGPGFTATAKRKHKNRRRNKQKNSRPQTCFGTLECASPSDGKSFRDCDLAGENIKNCDGCDFRRADLGNADLSDRSYQGASFRESNLRGAFLAITDFSGASFRDACLAGADFFEAIIDGADFRGAILCNTLLPDDTVDNSGCDAVTDCCSPCRFVGESCDESTAGDCCSGNCIDGTCFPECVKDIDCPGGDVCCSGRCLAGDCCADGDCEPFGNQCVSHECQCGAGASCLHATRCCGEGDDADCVDLENDDENCGFCGNVCEPPANCEEGSCGVG